MMSRVLWKRDKGYLDENNEGEVLEDRWDHTCVGVDSRLVSKKD